MGGGLMQLVAYGAQDIYLTGNPQITFFKVVYRRHTNFSMESIKQTFSGTAGYGRDVTSTISRNGDLISRIWLEHMPDITPPVSNPTEWLTSGVGNVHGYVPNYGHALIKEVELEIGGQTIDKHTGQWMQAWSDLTEFNPTAYGYAERSNTRETSHLIDAGTKSGLDPTDSKDDFGKTLFQKMSGTGNCSTISGDPSNGSAAGLAAGASYGVNAGSKFVNNNGTPNLSVSERIFIPFQFWFCRNIGLALPLIALQYHEVKLKIDFENADKLYGIVGGVTGGQSDASCTEATVTKAVAGSGATFDLWVDYIYLDTDERRRFAQVSHEYLIEQIQYIEDSLNVNGDAVQPSIDVALNFNHPVKELIWFARNTQDLLFETLPVHNDGGGSQAQQNSLLQVLVGTTGSGSSELKITPDADDGVVTDGSDVLADGKSAAQEVILRDVNAVGRQHGSATFLSDLSARKFGGGEGGSWQLTLNGHDRFAERDTQYFTRSQVRDYHTGFGGVFNRDSISVYSFALKPEEHQPSGTCNFSRIDTATLTGKSIQYPHGANELSIYAVNYNVLRIMSGMGGLAYSN